MDGASESVLFVTVWMTVGTIQMKETVGKAGFLSASTFKWTD